MKKDFTNYSQRKARSLLLTLALLLCTVTVSFGFTKSLSGELLVFQSTERTVSGTVKDENDAPLPGVSILIKGTTTGVITDLDGNYAINVDEDDILVFSFLGYINQEIAVNAQSRIDVNLQADISQLNEVVVIGYGSQKKSDLTGAVASADLEAFQDQPNVNILQSLQGSVAGLNVGAVTSAGANPQIRVRGRNTFAERRDENGNLTANQPVDPLIVLDGVIYRGSLADINPNDIASIDVLKDASSQAIYGSQAANGVVLITSKTGKTNRKPVINFSTYYSIDEPSNRLTPLGRQGFLDHYSKIFYEDAFLAPDYTQPNPDFDASTRFPYQSMIDGFNNGTETDWLDLVTQSAHTQNTNVSISGNANETSYFLSVGYTDQKGYVLNDQYNRLNLRANFENGLTDWLTAGIQTFVSTGDYSGIPANLRLGVLYSPLIAPFKEDGSLNTDPIGIDRNPLLSTEIDQEDKRLNLFGNFYLRFELPVEGLSYRINHGINYRTRRDYRFDKNGNNFQGSASKYNALTLDRTLDNLLMYQRVFNDRHSLDVTLLYGFEDRQNEETKASSGTFLNKALGFNSLESGDLDQQLVESGAWDELSIYQMGRVNYKYNDKYQLTITTRRDGFSGFGSNNKFGVFPSAAFAWTASNEDFVANALPWVDNLKVRVSYGQTGNRTVDRYQTLARVRADFDYVFGDGGASAYGQNISSLANNDLTWETTTGLNLGLDFVVLKNKLSGSINYYKTTTEDILFNVNIPQITGFETIPTNLGEVANNGLEISLTSINIEKNGLLWKSTVNFSKNNNKIVSILGRDDDNDGAEDDLVANSLFIGEPIESIFDYVDTGELYQLGDEIPGGYNPGNRIFEDLNGDGVISADGDRRIIGRSEPAYRFSIYNEVNYKNFTFSVFLNSIQGGKNAYLGANTPTVSESTWRHDNASTYNIVREFNAWSPATPNAPHPGVLYDDPIQRPIYKDRSFIRLQDIRLAYSLPANLLDKIFINNLRVFITGKNLHTWTDWEGTDPEINAGFNVGAAPIMRSYAMGVNLTF
ncbi:TonB-dependent receptor [Fulvivirgaceae bacterium BMA12]|uniref:TonB-dependent receptor n=1 Tax=Agaribacillus aureus TaxID=3051825 RepID=A0ABT8LJL3_9BACT|nr:TonB-dependent receptor [Fulvivirgaceae bacterium BMA12]